MGQSPFKKAVLHEMIVAIPAVVGFWFASQTFVLTPFGIYEWS
jgi:hypothetical protein